jgi:cysteine-S-conjugate beta-lyase
MAKKKSPDRKRATATTLAHAGRNPSDQYGFVNPPVYRGSTVLFPTFEKLKSRDQPYTYGRRGTPTMDALEAAICELEGGSDTILVGSGYQAVTTAILSLVETGDHILMTDSAYDPTRKFCDYILKRMGIETEYYDPVIGGDISELIRPNTKLVFTESPGSQTFEMQDIPAIVKAAKQHNVWVLTDNTWATPVFYRPLSHGVDIVIEACTKYIVGHADAMLGAITSNAKAAKHVNQAKETLGTSAGSEEIYLGLRGLRTLDVRLQRHHQSGLTVAKWLQDREEVARVIHPALDSHPGHDIWKRDFDGASGLFGCILKPTTSTALGKFLDGLQLFGMGYSWGGYESLLIPVDPSAYRTATTWAPDGPTLRLHIGLEDPDDLIADLEAGLQRLASG